MLLFLLLCLCLIEKHWCTVTVTDTAYVTVFDAVTVSVTVIDTVAVTFTVSVWCCCYS